MIYRSLLFIPADKEKMLLKMNQLQADTIILDLEDAVTLQGKEKARELVLKHFSTFDKKVIIRINDVNAEAYSKDIGLLHSIASYSNFCGVMLPKTNAKEDVDHLVHELEKIEKDKKRKEPIHIFPLIENASGVKNAYEIAQSSPRIVALSFGGVDYLNDIDGVATAEEKELLYPRSEIVVSSRAAGIGKPIDTVFVDIKNEEKFKEILQEAKSLGFGGKLLIHPNQITMTNEMFSPSEEEINEAKEIIENINEQGVFQLNGKMVDKPIIDKAKRVISQYNDITEQKEN